MGYLGVLSGRSKQKIKFGAQMGDAEYADVYINVEICFYEEYESLLVIFIFSFLGGIDWVLVLRAILSRLSSIVKSNKIEPSKEKQVIPLLTMVSSCLHNKSMITRSLRYKNVYNDIKHRIIRNHI